MQRVETIVSPQPIDGSPAADQALSRSLLDRVAAGEVDAGLRIWRPVPALVLTRLDELRGGAPAAVAKARAAGLPSVRRMSGGHAVVLGPGSLCAGVAEPAATFTGIRARYERFGDAVAESLGLPVERGELPGEWCPGAWSLRSDGVKLAGLAQRVIGGAAWTEAVIALAPDPVATRLLPLVYSALELPLDPSTIGSVSAVAGRAVGFDEVAGRLVVALGRR